MNIFKRIEVWVLLAVTAAGLVFVLLNRGGGEDEYGERSERSDTSPAPVDGDRVTEPSGGGGAAAKFAGGGVLEVNKVTVKRDHADYITEVSFSYDNQSETEVRTIEEAKVVTESGKAIPVFFLAFTGAPPVLPAKQKTDASLRFAIFYDDIVGSLTLDIRGGRVPIKSAHSFDPESIADQQSKTFGDLDW